MGSLITLAIYGAIAVAAMLAVHSFLNGYKAKGAAEQLAADTPIINACKVNRDAAIDANKGLQSDILRIGSERDTQSAKVKELSDSMAAQQADKAKRQTADRPKIAALQADSGTLEQRLAANTEGKSCDEKLSNIDRDLRATVGGVRVVPAGTPNRDAGKNPPAGPRAGKGTLRLSE
jgi:hypothetical protein